MDLYGLIGYPLSHSFSQKYFKGKFEQEKISDASFENFSIASINEFPALLKNHPDLKGMAVTVPYKKDVLQFLDDASDEVKQMGACNCIRIRNNKLIGYNTDVKGFEESFLEYLQPHHKNALILGTGGAAAAVEFVLKKLNIGYLYVSRKKTDDERKAISYGEITENLLQEYSIIINCTPLGTFPDIDSSPDIPYQYLSAQNYLFDLVYNPPMTKFLKNGAQYHATIKNGYDMLVVQAEENWKIWNGE